MLPVGSAEQSHDSKSRVPAYLPALAVMAAGATLARSADNEYLVPGWLAFSLQFPALIAWCIFVWGSECNKVDRAFTITAISLGSLLAISVGHLDALAVTTTSFICGMLSIDLLTRKFHEFSARLDRPIEALRSLMPSWFLLIFLITVVLALPIATRSGVPDYRHNFWQHIGNSAFNAVSAACLVGTSTYSFRDEYATLGKAVIVMTTQLSGFMFAAIGLAIIRPFLKTRVSLASVCKCLVALQLIAIIVTFTAWHDSDVSGSAARLAWSFIHVGSAFFNSGWTLRPDGFATYLNEPRVYASIALLAIFGSIGVPILIDLVRGPDNVEKKVKSSDRREPAVARGGVSGRTIHNPAMSSPCSLLPPYEAVAALTLLVCVAGFLWVCEAPGFLSDSLVPRRPVDFGGGRVCLRDDIGHRERWTLSVFIAATVRSAGLQSTPMSEGALSWPSYAAMIGAMILGGSAGGMAGGFRVTALLLPLIVIFSSRLRWASVPGGMEARKILLASPLSIAALSVLMNVTATATLAGTTDATWYECAFEAVAATSGVGLSTGLSLHLTPVARVAMMLFMLAGRMVPIVLWCRLASRVGRAMDATTDGR